MSVTHRIQLRFQRGNDVIDKTVVSASGSENNVDEPIPIAASDLLVAWACDFSQMKSFYMVCDQDLSIDTNQAHPGVDEIELVANEPMVWTENCGLANPFSTDVTALYVTNDSGVEAKLQVRKVEDPTV